VVLFLFRFSNKEMFLLVDKMAEQATARVCIVLHDKNRSSTVDWSPVFSSLANN
jgi:hypothetical protein